MKNLHQLINYNLPDFDWAVIWYVKEFKPVVSIEYPPMRFRINLDQNRLEYRSPEWGDKVWYLCYRRWSNSVITRWELSGSPKFPKYIET